MQHARDFPIVQPLKHGQHEHLAQFGRQLIQRVLNIQLPPHAVEAAAGGRWHFLAVALGKQLKAGMLAQVVQPRVARQRVQKRGELGLGLVLFAIVP